LSAIPSLPFGRRRPAGRLLAAWLLAAGSLIGTSAPAVTARRFAENPLLTAASSPTLGTKLNGPSVIRVPSWIKHPLGRYYLYFAHHDGKFIRLAYADSLHGPWTVHEPGTLQLAQAGMFTSHIASPDVHVDAERHLIRMYFHGSREQAEENQKTAVATSTDGLHFTVVAGVIGEAYFRVFEYRGASYAIDAHGDLNRSDQSDRGWVRREATLVPVENGTLYLFYSIAGEMGLAAAELDLAALTGTR
jgi:hypothetical protein